ncbi:hypothetical protein Gohar_026824 [Gossypium harknessii]|uniref:Pentatricopeptide repeat-containing protein n=1 Tax=Gossypium harknessii TaxID=34285 RepID=A0A7J9HTA6_9ROSI|nr:hypothetical protein [Gossypium harknessii]
MQGMCKLGRVSTACELFRKMIASRQVPDIVTFHILLDGLCKRGKLEEALKLFQAMWNSELELSIVCYNILIGGLCKAGHIEGLADEAYQLFRSMGDNDCLPNSCCYNVMIQGFLRNSYTLKATQLLTEMVSKGFSADLCTATLFLDLILRSDKSILI